MFFPELIPNSSQDQKILENSHCHTEYLTDQNLTSVETFVFFIGWPRSGHSIIGSLLDGHPDVIIAHEYFLFSRLIESQCSQSRRKLFKSLYMNSCWNAHYGYRTTASNKKGYNIELPNSWQGRFRTLKVIGDKTGGDATRSYRLNPKQFMKAIICLEQLLSVPLKVINVIRNPYDMVATVALYRGSHKNDTKVNATEDNKYENFRVLLESARSILGLSKALYSIQRIYNFDTIQVYSEEFIENPKKVMSSLCTFLELQCTKDYLQQCEDKAFKTVSKSRNLVKWTPSLTVLINSAIHMFPFFKNYDSDAQVPISRKGIYYKHF